MQTDGVAGEQALAVVADVDGLRVGIDAAVVRTVHRMAAVTPVARAPRVVEGVLDVGGDIVAVVDLRRRLARPPRPPRLADHLVEVAVAGRRLALHVDRAVEVRAVPAAAVDRRALPELEGAAGLARLDDGVLLIHDLAAFLTAEEGLQLDEALASRSPA